MASPPLPPLGAPSGLTGVQVVVGVQQPDGGLAGHGHVVAQEQVHGVLLLRVGVGVVVEAPKAGELVHEAGGQLPVAALALEDGRVGLRTPVLQEGPSEFEMSISYWSAVPIGDSTG